MSALVLKLFKTPSSQLSYVKMRVFFAGLWADFWKDPPSNRPPKPVVEKKVKPKKEDKKAAKDKAAPIWSGDRIQVMERMWGEGHAFPGGDSYIDMLTKPLGLTKEMSVLDLSAHLGSMARKIATDFGSYVTGMETDPALVSRGMILSIAAGKGKQATVESYDPETFETHRKYDCIFARELFFKIKNKDRLYKVITESLKKGGGQIVFTDFLVDSVSRQKPEIAQWAVAEGGATPPTLPEVVKTWKGMGFDLRVAEDQTDFYRQFILTGLARLLEGVNDMPPDAKTKLYIIKELDFWARRLQAFKKGLKYYRFYGIRY